MRQYGFGQKEGSVVQVAYVVPDLDAAIQDWITKLGVGPWFMFRNVGGTEVRYRGGPNKSAAVVAMAFSGTMIFELIQPLDDEPSMFKEVIDARGYGLHHVAIATENIQADIDRLLSEGHEIVMQANLPQGGSVAFLDGGPNLFGLIELIGMNENTDAMFSSFYEAAKNWDGSDPVREVSPA